MNSNFNIYSIKTADISIGTIFSNISQFPSSHKEILQNDIRTQRMQSMASTQSLHSLEKDLKIWHEMDQVKLETLCSHSVISKREQYIEFEELMTNNSLLIQDLTKDVQATLEMSVEIEHDMFSNFEKTSCKVLSHECGLLTTSDIVSQIVANLHQELDSDQFSMDTISKFVNHRMIFDKMQAAFKEHGEAIVRYYDVIIKTIVVARNTLGPDPDELQEIISKFLSFKVGNKTN
jgi:hypothetical protein